MKNTIKKWWFWVIILLIVIIIAFIAIMAMAFKSIQDEVWELASEIQDVYSDATVYASGGKNTLVLELNNWSNDYSSELSQIIDIVKGKIQNNKLQQYSRFITVAYLESNKKKDALLIRTTYKIPEWVEETKVEYVLFDEYKSLFDNYTNLFNSIRKII